jgi:hypothetical protein
MSQIIATRCLFLPSAIIIFTSNAIPFSPEGGRVFGMCFFMVVVGWFFSHQAMDAVAGKLPKDEQ